MYSVISFSRPPDVDIHTSPLAVMHIEVAAVPDLYRFCFLFFKLYLKRVKLRIYHRFPVSSVFISLTSPSEALIGIKFSVVSLYLYKPLVVPTYIVAFLSSKSVRTRLLPILKESSGLLRNILKV